MIRASTLAAALRRFSAGRFIAIAAVTLFAASFAPRAWAAAPANDNWVNRTTIASLPFATTEPNMSSATVEASDPDPPCKRVGGNSETGTLWYSYSTGAATQYLTLQVPDNVVPAYITVYTGSPGSFSLVSGACGGYRSSLGKSRLVGLRLAPNTTYSIKVGAQFTVFAGQTLTFNVAAATQYHVTKTADTNDGACDSDCSLREAISASNATPGAVIIPSGTYTLSIAGAAEDANVSGDLDVNAGMGVYGAGMTQTIIDANHLDRAMHLDAQGLGTTTYIVGDLTLRNGKATTTGSAFEGYGGGLLMNPSNQSNDFVGIERVAVTSNVAQGGGGGIAIFAPGTMRGSVVANNTVNNGSGGGVNFSYDDSRYLEISGSTISGNQANVGGGGGGIYAQGALRLTNSTVSENYAGVQGGGIWSESNGFLTMASSSVVFNLVGSPASGVGAGIFLDTSSSTNTISNSIIADNTSADPNEHSDCSTGGLGGTIASSYNLVQYPHGCNFGGAGDVTNVDALVSTALADNGGPTQTHALLTGSPALNSANPAGCKDTFGLTLSTDQRGAGFPRVVDGVCDKGALESPDSTPPGSPAVNPADDTGVSNNDGITRSQTPQFTGVCSAGTSIKLQVDAADIPPTTLCNTGTYAIRPVSALAEGTHSITATATNGAGASLRSAPLPITIDLTPPALSILTYPPDPDSNQSPMFTFVASEPVSSFSCALDAGPPTTCATPLTLNVGFGAHTFTLNAVDVAGNTSTPPGVSYSWSVLPPTPAAPRLDPSSDSGLLHNDRITNAPQEFLTGNGCTDGDDITIVDNGSATIYAQTCGSGVFSIAIPLDEGSHAIGVTATRSGYTGLESNTINIVIDRTPPAPPAITTPGGNVRPDVTISGTPSENDGLIEVLDGANVVCSALGPFASGTWSCNVSFMSGGAHTLTAQQSDVAGNVSNASAQIGVTVDLVFRDGFE